jgi:hypothetical protein
MRQRATGVAVHAALKFWRYATTLVLIITLAACGSGGSVSAAGLRESTMQESASKEGASATATGATSAGDAAAPAEVRYAP